MTLNMMPFNQNKLLLALLILLLGLGCSAEEAEAKRHVVVVYDDSGSMNHPMSGANGMKWAYANYGLQALKSLMADTDYLRVVTMLKPQQAVSLGSLDSIRQNFKYRAKSTPYLAVRTAMKHLQALGKQDDLWLLIITDGEFTGVDGSLNNLSIQIRDFLKETGAKVRILIIAGGKDQNAQQFRQAVISAWRSQPAACQILQAASGREIVKRMQDIAAAITSRQSGGMRQTSHARESTSLTFNTPFPLRRLTVLQQSATGRVAEIPKPLELLQTARLPMSPRESIRIKSPNDGTGTSLPAGRITHFFNPSQLISKGEITIKFAGDVDPRFVQLLPEVDVDLELSLKVQTVADWRALQRTPGSSEYKLCVGDKVRVEARLISPGFNQLTDSLKKKLLVRIALGGKLSGIALMEYDPKIGVYWWENDIPEGNTTIVVSADYEGYFHKVSRVVTGTANQCRVDIRLKAIKPHKKRPMPITDGMVRGCSGQDVKVLATVKQGDRSLPSKSLQLVLHGDGQTLPMRWDSILDGHVATLKFPERSISYTATCSNAQQSAKASIVLDGSFCPQEMLVSAKAVSGQELEQTGDIYSGYTGQKVRIAAKVTQKGQFGHWGLKTMLLKGPGKEVELRWDPPSQSFAETVTLAQGKALYSVVPPKGSRLDIQKLVLEGKVTKLIQIAVDQRGKILRSENGVYQVCKGTNITLKLQPMREGRATRCGLEYIVLRTPKSDEIRLMWNDGLSAFTGAYEAQEGQQTITVDGAAVAVLGAKKLFIHGNTCRITVAAAPWRSKVSELSNSPPVRLQILESGNPVKYPEKWKLKRSGDERVNGKISFESKSGYWLLPIRPWWWCECLTDVAKPGSSGLPLSLEVITPQQQSISSSVRLAIEDEPFWTKCLRLILLLAGLVLLFAWILGIIVKPRFHSKAMVEASSNNIARSKKTPLRGSLITRWLLPAWVPGSQEKRVLHWQGESITLRPKKGSRSVIWPKNNQVQMKHDSIRVSLTGRISRDELGKKDKDIGPSQTLQITRSHPSAPMKQTSFRYYMP